MKNTKNKNLESSFNNQKKALINYLNELRLIRNITYENLCHNDFLSRKGVYKILNNQTNFKIKSLLHILKILNTKKELTRDEREKILELLI